MVWTPLFYVGEEGFEPYRFGTPFRFLVFAKQKPKITSRFSNPSTQGKQLPCFAQTNKKYQAFCTWFFVGVGEEGFEPSIRKELVPKTSAYTNSATRP